MAEPSISSLRSLPPLSAEVQAEVFKYCCGLVNLWEHGLRLQKRFTEAGNVLQPAPGAIKTLLAVDPGKMTNLVPMDAPHPLYHDAPDCSALRHSFLLNAMFEAPLDLEDPALLTGVHSHRALYGKETHTELYGGEVTANDVLVKSHQALPDGGLLLLGEDLLFDQEATVREAFKTLLARTPSRGCGMGGCRRPLDADEEPPVCNKPQQ
ncbi:uncharacterized protein LOC108668216 [Hyalella azteca]|uniref:Uncharacterized protein LOC108668216 n=1 Tax=Hyalella azteca TaxID=294128 RepID=A0A8B7NBA1_HYAAZ|nr:uncharacterized protein LOC108668216 [Hyalella azteca]